MKLKGIWVAIAMILVIGCLSTSYFRTEQMRNTDRVAASARMTVLAETEPETILPDDVTEPAEAKLKSSRETLPALLRLQDLDKQIEKNHAGEADATANARKAAADNELRLWEAELSRILDSLEEVLDEPQKTELMNSQKQWLIDRENQAASASKKQIGSTLEELEYTIALADATRERAYELVSEYAPYLEEAENQDSAD